MHWLLRVNFGLSCRLVHRVKHRTEFRVGNRHFNQRRAGDEADVNVVIEEKRAWRSRRNQFALE
jgi:hypothetical protein